LHEHVFERFFVRGELGDAEPGQHHLHPAPRVHAHESSKRRANVLSIGQLAAHDAGIALHVYVDETRPRNQGAALTAFELGAHGVPHTVIADNTGGHLMQHGLVDVCLVGSDRTTAAGDVANKIGTSLKALAARDNGVPFYAALPSSTIDWTIEDGVRDVPIEERGAREVTHVRGRADDGRLLEVEVVAPGSPVANPAFDVTPARLVTGIITERGVAPASREGLAALYPDRMGT
jgi:methylthioribose-1-phosphate isomerase